MLEQYLEVEENRKICFEIYGDLDGEPVFFFHGWPGCRFTGKSLDKFAKKYQIQLICPDRPGTGDSDYKKNRRLLDWPKDVIKIADHLKIEKFRILTHSGGAPYAFVCAHEIPSRIEKVVVVNGLGIIKGQRYLRPLPSYWFFRICTLIPSFIGIAMGFIRYLRSKNERIFEKVILKNKTVDSDIVEVVDALTSSYNYAFHNGMGGIISDAVIYGSDWGFDPRKISIPVSIWHGTKDRLTPLPMSRKLHRMIKNSKLHVIRKSNHALIYSRTHDIFEDLIS